MYTVKNREKIYELAGLEYLLKPCTRVDAQLNLVLEPEVGSILDYKYSVNHVATKVAWYIPYVKCSRGGEIGSSGGG